VQEAAADGERGSAEFETKNTGKRDTARTVVLGKERAEVLVVGRLIARLDDADAAARDVLEADVEA
jgi:hypothetical protein